MPGLIPTACNRKELTLLSLEIDAGKKAVIRICVSLQQSCLGWLHQTTVTRRRIRRIEEEEEEEEARESKDSARYQVEVWSFRDDIVCSCQREGDIDA